MQRTRTVSAQGRAPVPARQPVQAGRHPNEDPAKGEFDTPFPLPGQSPVDVVDALRIIDSNTGQPTLEWLTGGNIDLDLISSEPLGTTKFSTNVVLAGGYIRSSNYDANLSGWAIDASGNAEFNNVLARGLLVGATVISTDSENMMMNPDAATDTSMWTATTNCTLGRTTSFSSSYTSTTTAFTITSTAAGDVVIESDAMMMDAYAGMAHGLSGEIQFTAAEFTSVQFLIDWYDIDDNLLSTATAETAALAAVGNYRIVMPGSHAPFYSPEDVAYFKLRIKGVAASAGSKVIKVTDIDVRMIGSVAARVGTFERLFVTNPGSGVTTVSVDGGTTDSTPLDLSTGTQTMTFALRNTTAVSTSNGIRLDFTLNSSTQARTALRIATSFTTTTDATRTSNIVLSTAESGTFSDVMAFVGGDVGIGTLVPEARAHIRGDTLGSASTPTVTVGTFSGGASTDDPRQLIIQGRVATTNATTTNLMALGLGNIPNMNSANMAVMFQAFVTARDTTSILGTTAGYSITGACYLSSGTATLIGTPTVLPYELDASLNATADCNGGNLRIRVTGKAATNITWHATVFLFPTSN